MTNPTDPPPVNGASADAGEMIERLAALDWATTPLGPQAEWPQSLRTAVDIMISSKQPMFVAWGPALIFLFNDAYRPILGEKEKWALGRPFREIWSEIWPDIAPLIDRALAGESTWSENLHLVMERNGFPEDTWYSFSYSPLRDESRDVAGMFCACMEKTHRVIADRQSTAERERLFAMTRDLFGVATFDGYLTSVNPAWSRILGRSDDELLSIPFAEIIHPDDLPATADVVAVLARGEPVHQFHVRLLRSDGSPVAFAWSAVPDATPGSTIFYTVGRDISDEQRREQALRQNQKLEALGQLTGGLAHDFNNLLQVVHGNLDLIQRNPADPARVARLAANSLQATDRGTRLTAQLLAFSRAQKLELRPVAVATLIAGMGDLLRRSAGPLVHLAISTGDKGLGVLVDPTQLEMALLNLAINARDAMPNGGEITIETSARDIADDADLASGRYVEIAVSDEGPGMASDVAARAFEPFFTTKGVGEGTGLGLSQVYAMARQAGGIARIDGRDPHGTRVTMLLQLVDAEPDKDLASEPARTMADQRTRTILVIDDDADVRQFLADSLETLGFDAVLAANGDEGLAILDGAQIDALLIDYAMPGMNGAEVAKRVRVTRPDLPILFATGYSDTASIDAVAGEGVRLIKKPFRVAELGEAFSQIFGCGAAG